MHTQIAARLNVDIGVSKLVLTQFLHNEITKTGFKKAVLGLSGGIDSALSCFLAVAALGSENVLALRMPYRASSADSLEHAQLIIDQLGIPSETVDITPMCEPLFAASPGITPRRMGNIMARMRMILLYDRSMAGDALVVGTSNKTELLLGYGTIFGDLASAVNPIGDLYKTQVRQLARALGVPEVIVNKAPTADLIPNQTDEGDLGFTYAEVDKLLYLLVDERYSPEEAVKAGFEADMVRRVLHMVQRAHYKRMMPVLPKISSRTITHDFRYLRDWGQ
ncbi:MAG: NAD+ synthase [Anaerolineales bacterium]|nr:NAD+ synthase [Anaerolineales bacterium]MCB8953780.1 NAD+ synthase [Ardenticatenales bacterium]